MKIQIMMSRQNLRSSKTAERSRSGEASQEIMDHQELNRTIIKRPIIKEIMNFQEAGGLAMDIENQDKFIKCNQQKTRRIREK